MSAKKRRIPKVVIVDCDDWKAIYVDGKLRYENHTLDADDVLQALGINSEHLLCDNDWLEKQGCRLPKNLKEVKHVLS